MLNASLLTGGGSHAFSIGRGPATCGGKMLVARMKPPEPSGIALPAAPANRRVASSRVNPLPAEVPTSKKAVSPHCTPCRRANHSSTATGSS